jgi:WhiB family transcriptional regulator, redox-sensing transcriptional regulator
MTGRTNWWVDAACRKADAELFFPIGTSGSALLQIEEAKWICRTCPVQPSCLACALSDEGTEGVWGGTTEDERRALRQDQKAHQKVR